MAATAISAETCPNRRSTQLHRTRRNRRVPRRLHRQHPRHLLDRPRFGYSFSAHSAAKGIRRCDRQVKVRQVSAVAVVSSWTGEQVVGQARAPSDGPSRERATRRFSNERNQGPEQGGKVHDHN